MAEIAGTAPQAPGQPSRSLEEGIGELERDARVAELAQCEADAKSSHPGAFTFSPDIDELVSRALERTLADSEYTEALVSWGECMSDNGFPGVQPLQLFGELRQELTVIEDNAEFSERGVQYDEVALQRVLSADREAAFAEAICTPSLLETRELVFRRIVDAGA